MGCLLLLPVHVYWAQTSSACFPHFAVSLSLALGSAGLDVSALPAVGSVVRGFLDLPGFGETEGL